MACSNYCTKSNFSQFSSSLSYGSRSKRRTATLSVTSERALVHSLERAKERYEVGEEASTSGDTIDDIVEYAQNIQTQHEVTTQVSTTSTTPAAGQQHITQGHVSSPIVTSTIMAVIGVTILTHPIREAITNLLKAERASED